MGLIRELRKAKSEATAAVKVWKANNPRRDGETLAQYRRRCQEAMQTQFRQTYGSPDWSEWLKIIMEVLKMIIPLLITCVLFALMLALPTSGQAADLQWSTLDGATVVAAVPAVAASCTTGRCNIATVHTADAGLVRGQPIRNAGRVIIAARPIRRVGAAIATAQPLRRAVRAVATVRPIRRVGKAVGIVIRARPLARLVGLRR